MTSMTEDPRIEQTLASIEANEFERSAAKLIEKVSGSAAAMRVVLSFRRPEPQEKQQLKLW